MKYPAFYKYLLSISRQDAAFHVFDCLKSGGEMVWDLMEDMLGPDWKTSDLGSTVINVIDKLHDKYGEVK